MRAILFVLGVAIGAGLAPWPATAQGAPEASVRAEAAAIQAVIAGQLDAFDDGDVEGAWAFASPMIQGIFGTADNFGTMVERGYPMVWDNRDAEFLELRSEGGALRQRVMIGDPAGRLWMLDYHMVETPEGWRIDGVEVNPAPEQVA